MSKILVIDDSRTMIEMLWSCLTKEGFQVLTAENGSEGIKAIEMYNPDIVITDIIMPVKSGVEVVMHLKFNHPATKVIAMSSGGVISARNHLSNIKKLGADSILSKPFNREEVLSAIYSEKAIEAA